MKIEIELSEQEYADFCAEFDDDDITDSSTTIELLANLRHLKDDEKKN
jgi:hypothetical protein